MAYRSLKSPQALFREEPELLKRPAVQELIAQYEDVCNDLIDYEQRADESKEMYLRVLVKEIQDSIQRMEKHNEEALRFGYDDQMDHEQALKNLKTYISAYLRDHHIYL